MLTKIILTSIILTIIVRPYFRCHKIFHAKSFSALVPLENASAQGWPLHLNINHFDGDI